ncbi:MAG: hypothetical protein MZV64_67850 [Ignavibacteriales bacterium]|nr:hypothetical protein [Ignavibacteriales bacterium]
MAVAGRFAERRQGRRGRGHLPRRSSSSTARTTRRGRPWPGCTGPSATSTRPWSSLNASADVRVEKGQFEAAEEVLREALAVRPGDIQQPGRPGRGPQEAGPDRARPSSSSKGELGRGPRQRPAPQHPRQHPLRGRGHQAGRGDLHPDRHRPSPQRQRPHQARPHPDPQGQARPGLRALRAPDQQPGQEAPGREGHRPAWASSWRARSPTCRPSERLALIYRSNKEVKKLEVVDRAILDELRKIGDKERMIGVYNELVELRPDDADLAREARALRLELGLAVEEVRDETPGPVGQGPRGHQGGHGPGRPVPPAGPRPHRPPPPREPPLPLSRGPPDREEDRRPRRGPDAHGRGRDPPPRREDQPARSAESREQAAEKKADDRKPSRSRPAEPTPRPRPTEAEEKSPRRPRPSREEPAAAPFTGRRPRRREGQHGRHLRRDGHHPLRQRGAGRADSTTTSRAAAAEELRWIAAARARQLRGDASPLRTGALRHRRRLPQGPPGARRRRGRRDPLPARAGLHGPGPHRGGRRGADPGRRGPEAGRRELHAHQPVLPAEAEFRRGREMAEDGPGRDQGRAPSPYFALALRAGGDPGGVRRPGRRRRRSSARSATGTPASGTPPPGSRSLSRPPPEADPPPPASR